MTRTVEIKALPGRRCMVLSDGKSPHWVGGVVRKVQTEWNEDGHQTRYHVDIERGDSNRKTWVIVEDDGILGFDGVLP